MHGFDQGNNELYLHLFCIGIFWLVMSSGHMTNLLVALTLKTCDEQITILVEDMLILAPKMIHYEC